MCFVLCITQQAIAQLVLFETNFVDFQVELNPTNNPDLQPLVDNFLNYVESDRYDNVIINRAVDGFVLQMASFEAVNSLVSETNVSDFVPITKFDPVVTDADNNGTADFDTTGLSNTFGEIALALSAGNLNSGTSSFYINLDDNAFLDSQGFIPFARIVDMDPINQIMSLDTFALDSNLTFNNVPVVPTDSFLVITRASVPEPSSLLLVLLGSIGLTKRNR